jgi:Tol biopolymer transport system component
MIPRRLILLGAGIVAIVGLVLNASSTLTAAPPNPPIRQLTNGQAIDVRPAWSPDYRQIAFQSNRGSDTFHIYVMNADGTNQRALTKGSSDDRHPAWTPDGKAIVFDSSNGNAREIWQVNVADGTLKQLSHLGAQANFPSVSGDGQRIAFYNYQNHTLDLWMARADGSQAKPLTQDLANANNNQCTFACHAAAWSPDNRTLAYSAGDLDDIWLVNVEGGAPREIIADGQDNHFPWFLPDGRLGYITEHINPVQSWTDAWAYDLTSQQKTLLQEQMALQGPFEWNRDNTQVLFHSPRSGHFEIYLIDVTVPGGVEALRGKSAPLTQADSPQSTTPNSASPQSLPTNPGGWIAAAGALGVFIAGGVIGVAWWRRSKH